MVSCVGDLGMEIKLSIVSPRTRVRVKASNYFNFSPPLDVESKFKLLATLVLPVEKMRVLKNLHSQPPSRQKFGFRGIRNSNPAPGQTVCGRAQDDDRLSGEHNNISGRIGRNGLLQFHYAWAMQPHQPP